jgi:PAS domain S-box-containing protein
MRILQNLKLSQQTLLLVLVPVVFELGFIVWMYSALSDMEKQAEQAEEARVLATHMNRYLRVAMDVAMRGRAAKGSNDKLNNPALFDDLRKELDTISELTKNKPAEHVIVRDLKLQLEDAVFMLNQLNAATDRGDLVAMYEMRGKLNPLLVRMGTSMERMRKMEAQLEDAAPHVISRRRELIRNVLIVGVTLNLTIALALAVLVQKGLVARLKVLSDNARAYRDGKPLMPALDGRDELASLDNSFRDMAQSLDVARSYEKAEAERLNKIVHSLPFGLAIVDENGKIVMANSTLASMLKQSEGELAGKALASCIEDEHADDSTSAGKKSTVRRSDGSVFPAELGRTSIETKEGTRELTLIVDITERLQMERMKQQFVAVVSHELRTPLTSVDNFLEMLKKGLYGDLSQSGLTSLGGVQIGVERLVKLTRDLLDIERLDGGYLQMEKNDVALSDVVFQSVLAVSGAAEKRNIAINVLQEGAHVMGDAERLVQVLVNLLSNALKFSPDGGEVNVIVTNHAELARVQVVDNGPGIAVENQKRIFDRFQQVSIDDSKKRGGAGLGLAICKQIIDQLDGEIGVSSELGKGSTFWFSLPACKSLPEG